MQIGRLPALPGTKNGRFVCESSVLCNTLASPAEEQQRSSSAIDFLLLPFLFGKKTKVRSLSLRKGTSGIAGAWLSFGNNRFPALPGTKNGRFVCESSVLCNTLANPAEEQPSRVSESDFLLLPFLSRKKRKRSPSVPSTPCLSAAAQATSCAKGCRRTHAVSSAPYLPSEGTRRRPAPPTRAAPTCVQAARSAVPAAAFVARLPVPRPSIYPSAVTPKSAKALRMSSSSSETVRTTSPR